MQRLWMDKKKTFTDWLVQDYRWQAGNRLGCEGHLNGSEQLSGKVEVKDALSHLTWKLQKAELSAEESEVNGAQG